MFALAGLDNVCAHVQSCFSQRTACSSMPLYLCDLSNCTSEKTLSVCNKNPLLCVPARPAYHTIARKPKAFSHTSLRPTLRAHTHTTQKNTHAPHYNYVWSLMLTTALTIYGVLQGFELQRFERLDSILDRIAKPIDIPVSGSKSVGSGEHCWLRVGTWMGITRAWISQ